MRINLGFGENARMGFDNLRQHKVRSFLTVVGVVIGVAALIGVGSIMVGLDSDLRGFLNDFGANTIFIYKFETSFRGRLTQEERMRKPLTREDAEAIAEQCPSVRVVAAEVFPPFWGRRMPPSARYKGNEVVGIQYQGATASYEQVYNVEMEKGRFFTDVEDEHRIDVAVLGPDLAEGLFGAEDPIGKQVLVSGTTYTVVGVTAKRKGQFFRDEGADREVRVPYRTYRKHHPRDDEHWLGAQAYPGKKAAAEDEIRGLLRRRRNVSFNKPDNFAISSPESIAAQFRSIMSMVALVTIVMASIGLMVGGVGVMNIMLMSVTERTREIGVRKALGARRRDIIRQFLTEAITLTGMGGVIGILFGAGISLLIRLLLPASVPLWAVVAGFTVSVSVGLFFGIYPAVKAAKLDPVEALRYE